MKVRTLLAAATLCLSAVGAWAIPTGSYSAVISGTSFYEQQYTFGSELGFDWWAETNAQPGSFVQGDSYDVLAVQAGGAFTYLGQVDFFYSTNAWAHANLAVPLALQGTTANLRFSLNDYPPTTDPVVYLRYIGVPDGDDGDNFKPIPEPSSLLLLGSGMLGFLGMRKMKKAA